MGVLYREIMSVFGFEEADQNREGDAEDERGDECHTVRAMDVAVREDGGLGDTEGDGC